MLEEAETICALCERDCSEIYRISFKDKTICGKCLTELIQLLRIKKGMKLVSLREIKLKRELERARKTRRKRKRRPSGKREDARAKAANIFDQKILPKFELIKDLYVSRRKERVGHDKLIEMTVAVLPLIYQELFQSTAPSRIVVRTKEVVGKREADIVLSGNASLPPFQIVEIEMPLPTDPFLRDMKEESLEKEIDLFVSAVGSRNLTVASYTKDKGIAEICSRAGVRYVWMRPHLKKVADSDEYYEKRLGSLWSRWDYLEGQKA